MTWITLLGRDHSRYGHLHQASIGEVACAVSVGADPYSPSVQFKRDPDVPNEDALAAYDDGERAVLAVADAHFGPFASHALIERLPAALGDVSALRGPADLIAALPALHRESDDPKEASESTLAIAVLDRAAGRCFGITAGDSSVVYVDATGARPLSEKRPEFISPAWPGTLGPHLVSSFESPWRPGDRVLAFTDGVDECHYRHPETSVGLADVASLYQQSGRQLKIFARRLGMRALNGVGESPGGQDNIALLIA